MVVSRSDYGIELLHGLIIYKYKSIILAPFIVAALAHGQILDGSKSAMVRVRQTLVLV